MTMLTYRQAATRVRRSVKTIKRWRRNGMPMGWELHQGQRVRVVDEEVLLGWFRGRLAADPVHQAKMRRGQVSANAAGEGSSSSGSS